MSKKTDPCDWCEEPLGFSDVAYVFENQLFEAEWDDPDEEFLVICSECKPSAEHLELEEIQLEDD